MIRRDNPRSRQRGGIAIIVALSGAVLLGFVGIALDVGRLYINKTELQTAADACALAAAAQLTCEAPPGVNCPAAFLQNAQAAGLFAAGRNRRDFQSDGVALTANDVQFSTALAPNANYLSIAAGANVNSRYAMCTANAGGILPWFMAALGSHNRFSATSVDQLPQMLASLLMYGHQLRFSIPDVDRTQYFLCFGANPIVSNGRILSAPGS